jgi:hypothetical protein
MLFCVLDLLFSQTKFFLELSPSLLARSRRLAAFAPVVFESDETERCSSEQREQQHNDDDPGEARHGGDGSNFRISRLMAEVPAAAVF